jgi:hypothetical protein
MGILVAFSVLQNGKNSDRIPKMILKYQPKGKRNLGRPLKRW